MMKHRPILPFFPQRFAQLAVITYILALITVSVVFVQYAMNWYWWIFGIVGVCTFFFGANSCTKHWAMIPEQFFRKRVFWTALFIRIPVMLFLYWFFNEMTGKPFMFSAADSEGYHDTAVWMTECIRNGNFSIYWNYQTSGGGVSDIGYPTYIGLIYLLTDDSIIAARLCKCIWSAATCVLIYNLARRNFGEQVGRMAAIFCMLEPHFIFYSGMHLKETEMLFLTVACLERTDAMMRHRDIRFGRVAGIVGLLFLTFCFRTVLGAALTFAIFLSLILSSKRVISLGKRWVVLIVFGLTAGYFVGGRVLNEVEKYWEQRTTNQSSRHSVIVKTNSLTKYATASVFAPLIFTIPFPTMVETSGQETSRMLHSAMVVKNFMSGFCILALVLLLLDPSPGGWRNNILIGSFLIGYLGILVFSAFAHADRFHMPAMPIEMMFVAFGVSKMNNPRYRRYLNYWTIAMYVAWVAWAWFKLHGRGLV